VPLTPAFGSEFTATQDQKTLTIRRTLASTTPVTYTGVYALDGSETRNKAPSSTVGQPGIETASTTAWDGNKLVITIWRPAQPGAGKQRRVLRLESDGTLMVETTTPGPNGAPPSSTTTAYKRARAK
jgi:hypothetical protein